jgi:threonylcarbamoyladenosine tRNA methylthiotransferase MtaB
LSISPDGYTLYHIMKTFSISTLGCKVNQYESEQIRELLEQLGLRHVRAPHGAHLAVINTCCVTHTASAKSRQYIRRAQRTNPRAAVVVVGCLPTVQTGEFKDLAGSVHLISNRGELVAEINRIVSDKSAAPDSKGHQAGPTTTIRPENGGKIKYKKDLAIQSGLPLITSFAGHTRAFLKVQDGCDAYCTYCIVPRTRPFVHSKPIRTVLQEARALVAAGHREIVVTGIFLGAYGRDSARRENWSDDRQNDKLGELLDRMAAIEGLARIRLSSLEPADVTSGLLDVFCRNRNIMPHLHLSLQSGSDAILSRMRRQYSAEQFREKVALIKSRLDRPAITTDIIVGFPGETEADFEQTVELAKEVGFAKMHVFGYSARRGTAAARMQDAVNARVIKERSRMLHRLNRELGGEFRRQFVGETAEVLVENANGRLAGRSERYFMVYVRDGGVRPERNELVGVRLLENFEDGMVGEVVSGAGGHGKPCSLAVNDILDLSKSGM